MNRRTRRLNGGGKTKRLLDTGDIVVYCFWYPDDRDLEISFLYGFNQLAGAAQCPVTAENE